MLHSVKEKSSTGLVLQSRTRARTMTGFGHSHCTQLAKNRLYYHHGQSSMYIRNRPRDSSTIAAPRRRHVHVTQAVIQSTAVAARLAHRFAIQYALPGRLLLTSASRMAGLRLAVLGLSVYGAVLTTWAILGNRFGWTDRVARAIEDRTRVEEKMQDLESGQEKERMLRLVLAHTKQALGSIDDDDGDISSDAAQVLVSTDDTRKPCPICGGTGRISYEAKFVHKDDPCPRCLGRGTLE